MVCLIGKNKFKTTSIQIRKSYFKGEISHQKIKTVKAILWHLKQIPNTWLKLLLFNRIWWLLITQVIELRKLNLKKYSILYIEICENFTSFQNLKSILQWLILSFFDALFMKNITNHEKISLLSAQSDIL